LLGVDKNRCDQEPGQNEKEIDPHPPVAEYMLQMKRWVFLARIVRDHKQDREAADGIELRDFALHRGGAGAAAETSHRGVTAPEMAKG
jgi:hypothetical protein